MKLLPKRLLALGCISLGSVCAFASNGDDSRGFIEGHLTIVSLKGVELAGADGEPPKPLLKNEAANYADHRLIVLTGDGKKEITRVAADQSGNYRIELPPGDYCLDVEGRISWKALAKPTRFTILPKQKVHIDMNVDIGSR